MVSDGIGNFIRGGQENLFLTSPPTLTLPEGFIRTTLGVHIGTYLIVFVTTTLPWLPVFLTHLSVFSCRGDYTASAGISATILYSTLVFLGGGNCPGSYVGFCTKCKCTAG